MKLYPQKISNRNNKTIHQYAKGYNRQASNSKCNKDKYTISIRVLILYKPTIINSKILIHHRKYYNS